MDTLPSCAHPSSSSHSSNRRRAAAFASLSATGNWPWKKHPSPWSDSASGSKQDATAQPGSALTAEQVQRDVQQLAQDVFHKGQVVGAGRYKLQDKIAIRLGLADARFTTIWHGTDLTTNRDVVLKCMEAGDTTSYTAGMREAALHAAAGRHPNILGLLDAFEHRSSSGRHPVMVLEPAGTNLLNVTAMYAAPLAREAAMSGSSPARGGMCDNPLALKRLAHDTLSALSHLHKQGIVHMDVSPDNVLLDKEFVSQEQALMPQGNLLKTLSTKWKLLQAVLLASTQPDKAEKLQQSLMQEMQDSVARDGRHNEGTLHQATFKLTDFGRAVPYKDLLGGQLAGAAAAGTQESQRLLQQPQRHNKDGIIVFSDPSYQPPEEILGMSYIAPSYDMWKLGCMLFEAATDTKLFDGSPLKAAVVLQRGRDFGFSDQHYMLDAMVSTLGELPRQFGAKSPLRDTFFYSNNSSHKSKTELLQLHVGPVRSTPRGKPLQELLLERTVLNEHEAKAFADFLSEVLQWEPQQRASAEQLLQHKWLQGVEPLQQ